MEIEVVEAAETRRGILIRFKLKEGYGLAWTEEVCTDCPVRNTPSMSDCRACTICPTCEAPIPGSWSRMIDFKAQTSYHLGCHKTREA